MKGLLLPLLLFLAGISSAATPPYKVGDPATDEDFRDIYQKLATHLHNNDGSSRFHSIIPDSDSLYNLGAPGTEWFTVFADTGSFSNIIDSSLTSGRIPVVGAIGLLVDYSNFLYNGTTVTAPINSASKFFLSDETIGFSGLLRSADTTTCLQNRSVTGLCTNGSGQVLSGVNGTAAIPQWTFPGDAGSGSFLPVSDVLGLAAGTMQVAQLAQSTTSDSASRTPLALFNGGLAGANANTPAGSASFRMQTTISLSSTTATKIMDITTEGAIVIVSGNDGSNYFCDLLITGFLATTPTVISSKTITASPPVRTYTNAASGEDLKVQMASGTGMKCSVLAIQVRSR